MKKLVSKSSFSFRVNGETVLEISPKGCVCSDEHAAFVKNRLGSVVTIEEVSAKSIAKEEAPAEVETTVEVEAPEEKVEEAPVEEPKVKKAKKDK